MARRKRKLIVKESLLNWKIYSVLALAFIAYLPSLKNDFVNWDDIGYIMNNDMIAPLSWLNFKRMFSTFFMGNYHPFAMLSLAIDHVFFNLNPHGYHFHNLLLHLINTFLVYCFIFILDGRKVTLALITSLLFAGHPMHVESVAWVSARKDLLYTMYFLMALISYLKYRENKNLKIFGFTLLLFVFSLLSKGQAVTLPLVLILIDLLLDKRVNKRILLEKTPFLLLSLIFGIVAIFAQREASYINPLNLPSWFSFFYAPFSIVIYLTKFIVPLNLTSVYEYPMNPDGTLPLWIYFAPLVFLVLIYILWKSFKSSGIVFFGLLFFLLTILPIVQYLPVGKAIVAERYSYVPYIGLGYTVAFFFIWFMKRIPEKFSGLATLAGLLFCLWLCFLTWNRCKVWKDSIALWTDVLEKNPLSVNAYMNRAFIYDKNGEYDKVIQECDKCLAIDSSRSEVYKNRGIAWAKSGNYNQALFDYTKAIQLDSADKDLYLFRGIIYTDKLKEFDSGIRDFKKYLTISPHNENVNFNLIVAYFNKQNFDSARFYCKKVLEINPENAPAKDLLIRIDTLSNEKKPD